MKGLWVSIQLVALLAGPACAAPAGMHADVFGDAIVKGDTFGCRDRQDFRTLARLLTLKDKEQYHARFGRLMRARQCRFLRDGESLFLKGGPRDGVICVRPLDDDLGAKCLFTSAEAVEKLPAAPDD